MVQNEQIEQVYTVLAKITKWLESWLSSGYELNIRSLPTVGVIWLELINWSYREDYALQLLVIEITKTQINVVAKTREMEDTAYNVAGLLGCSAYNSDDIRIQ